MGYVKLVTVTAQVAVPKLQSRDSLHLQISSYVRV